MPLIVAFKWWRFRGRVRALKAQRAGVARGARGAPHSARDDGQGGAGKREAP